MRAEDLIRLQRLKDPQIIGTKAVSFGSFYVLKSTKALEKLKTQIGVDVLTLESAEWIGEKRKARFNIGKYIRDDLYISYTHDIFSLSKYSFKTEYSPWKFVSLIGETEENKIKAGIQFKFRY
jgi:autotransporter translocation and assembly factor TamB